MIKKTILKFKESYFKFIRLCKKNAQATPGMNAKESDFWWYDLQHIFQRIAPRFGETFPRKRTLSKTLHIVRAWARGSIFLAILFFAFLTNGKADSPGVEKILSQKISVDYKEADLINVLRSLALTYGLNIVSSPEVEGKVSLTLKDISLKDALNAIVSSQGFRYYLKDGLIYVKKADKEYAELKAEVVSLKNISAQEAVGLISHLLSSQGDVKANETANSLIITDLPENIEKIKKLLSSVDLPPQQVLIEAKIVDVTLNDLAAYGVQWDIDYNPQRGLFNRQTRVSEELKGTISLGEQSSDLTGGQFTLNTLTLKNITATATIDALVKNGKASLLASPSIAVLNGEEARIVIGERFPYKERTQTTTGTTETTKFVDIGVTLKVTPQINEDGYITMRLHPEVSSLQSALDAGPRITTREADTTVRIKNGETLVIAGLIKHTDDASKERIPFLGKIPILGFFFSRSDKKLEQKELTIFITPHIISSDEKENQKTPYFRIAQNNTVERIFQKARSLEKDYEIIQGKGKRKIQKAQALNFYEYIFKEFPKSIRAPEALYRAGIIAYYDLGDKRRAYYLFSLLKNNYPEDYFTKKAASIYGKLKLKYSDISLFPPRKQNLKSPE